MSEYGPKDFHRRKYTVESDELNNARVEIIVKVNGKQMAHMQAREPGIIAFVSKPKEEGFDLEIVQPGGFHFSDAQPIAGVPEKLAPWQVMALDLPTE